MILYDRAWKAFMQRYLQASMSLLFPTIEAAIDWSRGGEFLNKEFHGVLEPGSKRGQQVDLLVRLWLKSGAERILLLHVEFQNQEESAFATRVYLYHAKVYESYRENVVSLAILGDLHPKWRPSSFSYHFEDFALDFHFPVAKLLDFKGRESELQAQKCPFAYAILAHLASMECKNKPAELLQHKLSLSKSLFRERFSRQEILDLYRFIEALMPLKNQEEKEFQMEMTKFKNQDEFTLLAPFEKKAMKKGRRQGKAEGKVEGKAEGYAEILIKQLTKRFGALQPQILARVASATQQELSFWAESILDAQSLDELFGQSKSAIAKLEV